MVITLLTLSTVTSEHNNYIVLKHDLCINHCGLLLYVFIWKSRLLCGLCFIWVCVIELFRSSRNTFISVIPSLSDLHVLNHDLHICWNVCIEQRKWFLLLPTSSGRPV